MPLKIHTLQNKNDCGKIVFDVSFKRAELMIEKNCKQSIMGIGHNIEKTSHVSDKHITFVQLSISFNCHIKMKLLKSMHWFTDLCLLQTKMSARNTSEQVSRTRLGKIDTVHPLSGASFISSRQLWCIQIERRFVGINLCLERLCFLCFLQ